MLVQCPKCRTTYKVSDDVLSGAAPAFRCSRCKHTFEFEPDENREPRFEPSQAAETAIVPHSPANELSLPFGSKPEPTAVPSDAEQEPVLRETQRTGAASESEDRHRWGIGDTAQPQEKPFVLAEPNRPVAEFPPAAESKEDDPFFHKLEFDDPEQNATNITAISPYLDHRASIKPFVTLFTFLVIGFALLAAIGYARPQAPESVLRKIPLIGAAVLRNNHLKEGILIKSLTTTYQTIQGNREVFLVSGIALNQNPVIVREIQLTGTVYNDAGKEIERQAIWAGNTLSPKIIRGMTLEDIPQLQELKPLKSFELPPGDSIPFTIVFLKSSKNAKEFTCEVTTAGEA
jgi:predicted Zn finger-like uncharacterized protein